jgi:hypothetical protein
MLRRVIGPLGGCFAWCRWVVASLGVIAQSVGWLVEADLAQCQGEQLAASDRESQPPNHDPPRLLIRASQARGPLMIRKCEPWIGSICSEQKSPSFAIATVITNLKWGPGGDPIGLNNLTHLQHIRMFVTEEEAAAMYAWWCRSWNGVAAKSVVKSKIRTLMAKGDRKGVFGSR